MSGVQYKVSKEDKDRLVELTNEAKQILDKYGYTTGTYVHVLDRAKKAVLDSKEWCNLLEVNS